MGMVTNPARHKTGSRLLIGWAICCSLFFILFAGKETYVQWSNLALWQQMVAKLERLNPLSDLFNLLWSITGMLVFSSACLSLGAFISRNLKLRTTSPTTNTLSRAAFLATEFLIGNGVFSLIFLTLGGLYQLTPTYTGALLLVGGFLGLREFQKNFAQIISGLSSAWRELTTDRQNQLFVALCTAILCFSLFYSTARISYDSSAIYFSNAKLTALNHHVQFFTGESFIVSAFHNAIQYSAIIQLFGDQSARLFSWFSGIIFIFFTMAIARSTGISRQGILVLLAILLTSSVLLDLMGDGKVDVLTSGYAIAAVYWMIVESQGTTSARSAYILIGFLAGFAMIGRPFNVFILGVFIGLFYVQRAYLKRAFEPLDQRRLLTAFFCMGVVAIGLEMYHLFANWMIQGNPFAFLSSVTKINPTSGPWDYDPDQILAIRLLYPLVATFYNSPQTLGNISPLVLGFLPAFLIPGMRQQIRLTSELKILSVVSMVTLAAWIFLFFTVYEIRYVLFMWALLFIPVAQAITAVLENKDSVLQQLSRGLILLLLTFFVVRTVYISLDTYSPVDKHGNPQCFCDSLAPINEAASPGDRVLSLSAFRYYLRTDLFACSTKHDEYKELQDAASIDADAFWREVQRQGYRYISYEHDYTTRHLEIGIIPSPENAPEWLELVPLYSAPGGTHIAYRIDINDSPDHAEASCQLSESGRWQVQYDK